MMITARARGGEHGRSGRPGDFTRLRGGAGAQHGDALLRTTQQHHVQLSVMADTKANILITVSSIILTLILGKMTDPNLRAAMTTLAGFIFTALLLAVVTVLPKYRPLRIAAGAPLPPNFNLLFFGHFSELPKERFLLAWRSK
jgi:hypothetical protein